MTDNAAIPGVLDDVVGNDGRADAFDDADIYPFARCADNISGRDHIAHIGAPAKLNAIERRVFNNIAGNRYVGLDGDADAEGARIGPLVERLRTKLPLQVPRRPPLSKLTIDMPFAAPSTRLFAMTAPSNANSE